MVSKNGQNGWLEDPLNFVEIKHPFGFLQTNPQVDAWRGGLILFLKKVFFGTPYWTYMSPNIPV